MIPLRSIALSVCRTVLKSIIFMMINHKHRNKIFEWNLLFLHSARSVISINISKYTIKIQIFWRINYLLNKLTSPANACPFTVCSDPLESLHPQWQWYCSSLYTSSIKGPPLKTVKKKKEREKDHYKFIPLYKTSAKNKYKLRETSFPRIPFILNLPSILNSQNLLRL